MILFTKIQKGSFSSEVYVDKKIQIIVTPIRVIYFNSDLRPITMKLLYPSSKVSENTFSISQTMDSYLITLIPPLDASYVAISLESLIPFPDCISEPYNICDYLRELFFSNDLFRVYEKYKDRIFPSFPNSWIGREIYGYKIVDVIGEGGNSYVLKGYKDGRYFAIKLPKISNQRSATISSFNLFKEIFNEAGNLVEISAKSENLVKIFAIYMDVSNIKEIMRGDLFLYLTSPPALIMEYVGGGDSRSLIQKGYNFSSNWERIVAKIGLDIAQALKVLHTSGYVHLDVKPSNFLLTKSVNSPEEICNTKVKLGDLGSAKRVREIPTHITASYAPPEQFLAYPAMPVMDVFSLGASLFALIWGKSGFNPDEIIFSNDTSSIYQKYVSFYTTLYYSPLTNFQRALLSLIYPDYKKRPSILQVIELLRKYSC